MKRLGKLLPLPAWDANPSQGSGPQHLTTAAPLIDQTSHRNLIPNIIKHNLFPDANNKPLRIFFAAVKATVSYAP